MDDHTVVGRALAILETVASSSDAVTLAHLARTTGLPKPTALRIANDLVGRGLLVRTDGTFTTGPHLRALGALALDQATYRGPAGPLLQELHARTRQLAFLAVLDGRQLVLVDVVADSGAPRPAPLLQGRTWSLSLDGVDALTCAAGRVVLAEADDGGRSLVARGVPRMTPYTVTSRRLVLDALRRVRDDGVAVEREQRQQGWSCVAAPIRSDSSVVAVVGLIGRSAAWAPERLAPVVRTGATALSGLGATA